MTEIDSLAQPGTIAVPRFYRVAISFTLKSMYFLNHPIIHPGDAKKNHSSREIFTQAPPPGASFKVKTSFLLTVFVDTVLVSRLVW